MTDDIIDKQDVLDSFVDKILLDITDVSDEEIFGPFDTVDDLMKALNE